VVVLFYIEKL